jgi:tetratricopeptide (TPR) repeat protein
MSEPQRLESAPAPEAAERDSRAEALLVEGLDHYFAARYEDAIQVWTRVLFLDRTHARARAYIDRARTALAERQRQSEELLETSQDLLAQGHTDAARQLLTEAVAASGDDERAAALRVRLERVERIQQVDARLPRSSPAAPTDGAASRVRPRRAGRLIALGLALAGGLLFVAGAVTSGVREWVGLRRAGEVFVIPPAPQPFTVLSGSDVALVRARNLYTRGRLAEALQALNRVSPDSAIRRDADELRVKIQQLLLAGGRDRASARRPNRQ